MGVEGSNSNQESNPNPYPIKTVVVLVQENRSFDHMLGWMKQLNPDINGVSGPDEYSNPVDTSDPNSKRINFGDESVYVDPDPGHSIQDIYEQVRMESFPHILLCSSTLCTSSVGTCQ